MNFDPSDTRLARQLRSILLELARREDSLAADGAAATPYWSPGPATILGHRSAATLLRAEANHLLAG